MWSEIVGNVKRFAGSSGTVTIPAGGHVINITAHCTSAGTVAFWDGVGGTVTVPVPASTWFVYDPKHLSTTANALAGNSIVFTTTDSYLVEVVLPSGT
jgi:hypothetical protein